MLGSSYKTERSRSEKSMTTPLFKPLCQHNSQSNMFSGTNLRDAEELLLFRLLRVSTNRDVFPDQRYLARALSHQRRPRLSQADPRKMATRGRVVSLEHYPSDGRRSGMPHQH